MAKVTYLIGAGASAGALPVVANFADEIGKITDQFIYMEVDIPYDLREAFDKAKKDLDFLSDGCRNHMSVDTFCRMLYLTNREDEYRTAKCAIILFFDLYRYFNQSDDMRYDAFLAGILKKEKPRFPNEINIISWNYDCEFEKAFLNYHNPRISMEDVYGELNVIHKNSKSVRGLNNNFGIIKINGTTGFYKNNRPILGLDTWNVTSFGSPNYADTITPIIKSYHTLAYEELLDPMISFAWEDDNGELKLKDEIEKALTDTEVLVVIGYSFPYFNRVLDRHTFNMLESTYKEFMDVYIQDINAVSLKENVIRLLGEGTQASIHLVKNVDQFHIPHELD